MLIRVILTISILSSIGLTYYTNVVLADFVIISNPDGPNTTDYIVVEDAL